MAGLSLVNVKKIYPATNDHKKSKKKHESGEEKKAQLQVTNEGVVPVCISSFLAPAQLRDGEHMQAFQFCWELQHQ